VTNDSLMTDRLTEQSQATSSTADVSFPGRKLCDKRMTRMGRAISHMSGSLPTAAIDSPRRFGSYSEFPITLRNECNAQPTVAQFVGHIMCGSMVDIHFAIAENRRGKKKEQRIKKKVIAAAKYSLMSASAMQGGHNKEFYHVDFNTKFR